MNTRYSVILLILASLCVTGCSEQVEDAPPSSRPVKIFTVQGPGGEAIRSFPGSVQASQRADLSFRVPGTLQEILVREGESVKQGQLLARLDPADYQTILDDRQASFDNAERNFKRAKELITDGNISKLDYDRMEANFRSARAALTQAQQDVDYTELKAPFDGTVGSREVENFEDVQAKQTVFRFQNVAQLDIFIDLPESLVRSLGPAPASSAREAASRRMVTAMASFEGRPDARFPLDIKEVATKADSQTQTFRVTLTMPQPEEFRVLPGMTATVKVDFSKVVEAYEAKWLPLTAVQADSGLDARVWILDPASMTVSSQPVKIGRMSGRRIEVTDGLNGGEEVVSVGAPYLSEGMRVTRMQQTEQAVPREDEA